MLLVKLALYFALIKFTWTAPSGPAVPTSYKLCIGASPGQCTTSKTVAAPALETTIDMNVSTVQYVTVTASNQYGDSDASNQVVVGKPLAPGALTGSLSGN